MKFCDVIRSACSVDSLSPPSPTTIRSADATSSISTSTRTILIVVEVYVLHVTREKPSRTRVGASRIRRERLARRHGPRNVEGVGVDPLLV